MKRVLVVAATFLLAAAAYAATGFTLNPSEMKSGESKKLIDGDRTITVTRNGDAIDVHIEGAGSSESLGITRGRDGIRIERGGGGAHTFVLPPNIEGLESMRIPAVHSFRFNKSMAKQTWFVCPKDHTLMKVPDGSTDQTFKCPVDGTAMEKRKGNGFAFFFNDDFEPENM